jgi:hypothetical protein
VAVHDSRQNDRNPNHLASQPGLPHGRRPPSRPRPAQSGSAWVRAGRPRTLTTTSTSKE